MRLWILALILGACTPGRDAPDARSVHMDFDRASFFDAPFPDADLVGPDGTVDVSGFPNPYGVALVDQGIGMLDSDAHGASIAGAVFFTLSGPIDPSVLPDLAGSLDPGSLAQLIDLDTGERAPLRVSFEPQGGPYGAANMLALLPLQGRPLHPGTPYAAVLLRHAGATSVLARSDAIRALARGQDPPGVPAAVADASISALKLLPGYGVPTREIAGLSVFNTDDPTQGLFDRLHASTPPALPASTDFTAVDDFDRYCVREATMTFDDWQSGTPPYLTEGGGWADSVQRQVQSRVFVTIPHGTMPANGWPLVLLVRTGAGADDALVDRGAQATPGGPSIVPGSGPGDEFAKVGFAGIQVDGPLGGIRNPSGADEQYLVYNFQNGLALRDNIRESALELALLASELGDLQVPDCNGGTARFDGDHLALFGHSTGASISIPTLAAAPMLKAAILGGAGASFIENVEFKEKPFDVLPLASQMTEDPTLNEFDPVLTLVQWAEDPAEAMAYAPLVLPRHVFIIQGIPDHYIPPPVANALALALPVDLVGPSLDATTPETADYPALAPLLPFAGRSQLDFPAQGNEDGSTAVVAQFPADGIEDGHEVMFQSEPPKHLYRCFLQSLLAGTPQVVSPDAPDCP